MYRRSSSQANTGSSAGILPKSRLGQSRCYDAIQHLTKLFMPVGLSRNKLLMIYHLISSTGKLVNSSERSLPKPILCNYPSFGCPPISMLKTEATVWSFEPQFWVLSGRPMGSVGCPDLAFLGSRF